MTRIQSFSRGKPSKLYADFDKDQAVAVGWDAKEKKAGHYLLGDRFEMRHMELSSSPEDANDFMYLCARAFFVADGKKSKKDP